MTRNYILPSLFIVSVAFSAGACGASDASQPTDILLDVALDVTPDVSADMAPDVAPDVAPDLSTAEDTSGCPRGFETCGTVCVDKSLDPDHCGACDNFCGPTEHCRQGECVTGGVLFSADVSPLLLGFACSECHRFMNPAGLVNVTVHNTGCRGELRVVPGDPDNSALVRLISGNTCGFQMPPEGQRMSDVEVGLIRRWIAEGALDN